MDLYVRVALPCCKKNQARKGSPFPLPSDLPLNYNLKGSSLLVSRATLFHSCRDR